MRAHVWWVLGAMACAGDVPDKDDTDNAGDTDAPADTDGADTDFVWETGGGGLFDTDADGYADENIGPTSIDGTYTGTFSLRHVVPVFSTNPLCEGTVSFVIDGTAYRHGLVDFACAEWDPNIEALGGLAAYAELDGIGVASINPDDLTQLRFDLFLRAGNMDDFDEKGVSATIDGDTLTIDFDNVSGLGALRSGFRLDVTATREPTP